MPRLERFAPRLAAAALVLLAAAPAWAFDLAGLMAAIGRRGASEATFTEQRFIVGLDRPLSARGVLAFTPPDRLVRRTSGSRGESMVVEGNQVTLERGGRSRTLALDSVPEMAGLVEALRATLGGDARALQQHFRATLAGTQQAWALTLVPLDARLGGQVQELRLDGSGGDVRTVALDFRNGDRTLTTLTPQPAGALPPGRP